MSSLPPPTKRLKSTHEENDQVDLNSEGGTGSEIWKYFSKEGDWSPLSPCKEANCLQCKHLGKHKVFACGKDGSIGSLWRHLKAQHKSTYIETKKFRDSGALVGQTILSHFGVAPKKAPTSFQMEEVKLLLSRWVVQRQHPFTIVEEPEFRKLLLRANPAFNMIGADCLQNFVLKTFESKIDNMKSVFNNVQRLSMTTDLWTSGNQHSYIGVTIHYVDKEYKLQNHVLDFAAITGPHDGKNIAKSIFEILQKFGISSKLLAITVDNAANNKTMVQELQKLIFNSHNQVWDSENMMFRCFAHVLNLVVVQGMKEPLVDEIVSKLRNLVVYIRGSTQRLDDLESCCDDVGIPRTRPSLDVCTRWNSVHIMIQNALKLKDAINKFFDMAKYLDVGHKNLTNVQWNTISSLGDFLCPFHRLSQTLCASEYPTCGSIIPLFNKLFDTIDSAIANTSVSPAKVVCQQAAKAMHSKLWEYYNKTNVTTMIVTFLDPRFRLKYFAKNSFGKWVDQMLKEIKLLLETKYSVASPSNEENTSSPATTESASLESEDDLFRFSELEGDDMTAEDDEVSEYTRGKLLPMAQGKDVLSWWKDHKAQFPGLARMAKDYLAIPATSAPCERLFSAGNNMVTDKRNRLATRTVQAAQSLRGWWMGPLREDLDAQIQRFV